MFSRRRVLAGAAVGVAAAQQRAFASGAWPLIAPEAPRGVADAAKLEVLPGKAPLIALTRRPPNYETPLSYFDEPITPNEAFFVRYHHAVIPKNVDAKTWRLFVGGEGAAESFELSLAELQAMPAVEIVAVLQCAGNRRALVSPHVAGVQWGYGAMGAAQWTGVRLKDVLRRAGLKREALEIVFHGADQPPLERTPKFTKSIPVAKALEDEVILAYAMNGAPLPLMNGFPLRLVVPGWTGTYWMKHLTAIAAVTKPLDNYWMTRAYRLPRGKFAYAAPFPTQENETSVPITEIAVNALVTAPANGQRLRLGESVTVRGLAWDAGRGVDAVEVSTDGGVSFSPATLGEDHGRFAFREFFFAFAPSAAGAATIVVNARNKIGQTQTTELVPNPGGYHHNLMPRIVVEVG